MTMEEARAFIAQVPWRHVKMVPVGEGLADGGVERWGEHRHLVPDPHEYAIRDWPEVHRSLFDAFVRLIKSGGLHGHLPGALSARVRDDEPLPRDRRLVLLVHPSEHAQPRAGRAPEAQADSRADGSA